VTKFLFIFGYESPSEWTTNRRLGTDDESSFAVWVHALDEQSAMAIGRAFAQSHVDSIYASHPECEFSGWLEAGYAHWIEQQPLSRFSESALNQLNEINPDNPAA
jgi:hypothetical protein